MIILVGSQIFMGLLPSDSYCATCDWAKTFSSPPEAARALALKKASAIRMGLPPRLAENLKFQGATTWIIRVITKHKSGKEREARFRLNLGSDNTSRSP